MSSPHPDLTVDAGAEAIAASLLARGCTVVRGLFDARAVAAARERIERRFVQLDPIAQGVYCNNLAISFGDASGETVEIRGHRVDMPVLLATEAEKTLSDREPQRFDHTTLRLVVASPAAAIARAYFAEPPVVAVGASRVRRQRLERRPEGLPLHQDAGSEDYGSAAGLTVFFPLNGCGGRYPGLEVLPERVTGLLSRAPDQWYCDAGVAARLAPRLWAPDLEPGDAIIFDSYCPHRTYFGPGVAKERLSCDVRLFARSHAPKSLSAMIEVG